MACFVNGSRSCLGVPMPLSLLAWLLSCANASNALYVAQPVIFQEGDEVPLNVKALTSIRTLIPQDFYGLPFCIPDGGPRIYNQSFAEFFMGDKIQSSPYTEIKMKKDLYCQQVCQVTLDQQQATKLGWHIQYGYHHNGSIPDGKQDSKLSLYRD
jgi:transmembrane 9 superfamily member 2/4